MQEFLKFFDLTTLDAIMIVVAIPLFVLFQKACNSALIKPFLDRINERDQMTVGAGSSAESIVQEARALEEEYSRKINDARMAAMKSRAARIESAKEEAAKIVEHAETEVSQRVTTERQKVRQQLEAQRAQLMSDVDALAQGVVQKLSQPRALSALALLIAVSVFLEPLGAWASSEHGAHGGYDYLMWYWINFALYIVAMYFILRNMVASGWVARRERIRFALEAGKRALEEANARQAAAKEKLARADKEVAELATSIEVDSQKEALKLVSDARSRAVDIQAQATESLGMEAKAQRAQMQREIADVVLNRATELLKKSVTKESDRALRQGAIAGVKNLIQ